MEMIPFIAHESALHRAEKNNKRMFILCIILIAALILSNIGWVVYELQWETVTETTEIYDLEVDQNAEGDVSFAGRDNINGSPKD